MFLDIKRMNGPNYFLKTQKTTSLSIIASMFSDLH